MDVHKRTISFCAKRADGTMVKRGRIPACRDSLTTLIGHWPTTARPVRHGSYLDIALGLRPSDGARLNL
jgi:hypothetical protein